MRTVCILVLCALLGACEEPKPFYADGSSGSFADLEGRWVAVNYWAEWCAPCRHEIPELNELHTLDTVDVVGVNFDGLKGEKLTALIETMQIEFPVLLEDPRERWGVELPAILPTTLLIDPGGALTAVRRGPQTKDDLLRAIEAAAAEAATETEAEGAAGAASDSGMPSAGS